MKTHIFRGNQYVESFNCDGRKYSKWQVFKFRAIRRTKRTMLVMAGLSVIGWSVYAGSNYIPRTVWAEKVVTTDMSDSMFKSKIDSLKDKVVAEILSCESAGYKESDGLIIMDTNKKLSVGLMQWQVSSVQYYSKTLNNVVLTPTEAIKLALDKEQATKLARDVMFRTKNKASKDWYNCSQRFNSDAKIDMILAMEK